MRRISINWKTISSRESHLRDVRAGSLLDELERFFPVLRLTDTRRQRQLVGQFVQVPTFPLDFA